jgi:hypothetical protein
MRIIVYDERRLKIWESRVDVLTLPFFSDLGIVKRTSLS